LGKPKPNESRLVAFELVSQVNRDGAYANLRLPELLANCNLNTADKAFTTELAYGTLRMQGKHDYLACKYLDRPINELDGKILDLLRIGIHQVTEMRVQDHAAVSETVELAKFVAGESKASYVNAILRKITTNKDDLSELNRLPTVQRLSIQHSHPEWIVSAFYDQLKNWDEVEKLLISNNLPVTPDVVSWPTKSTHQEFSALGAEKIDGYANGFKIPVIPSNFEPIIERRAGVQDRGSQIVVENFLKTYQPGLSWLDICAGPGGKAAYLYYSIKQLNASTIFLANEPNQNRADLVKRVIGNDLVESHDGTDPSNFSSKYDRILVDAPCTGLGALRRRPESRWRKSPNDLKALVLLQRRLLASSFELLKPGGLIAYVTCSPHLAETKGQVIDFLGSFPQMSILPLNSLPLSNPIGIQDDGTMQLWTHKNHSDAMFMALFQRNE
jgi:16S rRNA (cytosine967-C5)-methyltransferase